MLETRFGLMPHTIPYTPFRTESFREEVTKLVVQTLKQYYKKFLEPDYKLTIVL